MDMDNKNHSMFSDYVGLSTHAQTELLGRHNRNKEFAHKTATSYRARIFAFVPTQSSLPDEQESSEQQLAHTELLQKIGLVGYKTKDGCFYSGFFSRENFILRKKQSSQKYVIDHDQTRNDENNPHEVTIPCVPCFPFNPRGKIDSNGKYHPYYVQDNFPSEKIGFPTLNELIKKQTGEMSETRLSLPQQIRVRKLSLREEKRTSEVGILPESHSDSIFHQECSLFNFCLRDGTEVKISELLSSGLWRLDQADEYFVAGVFNYEGK